MNEQTEPDELEVLMPDATVIIDGETIEVRELRFGEALRLAPLLEPLVNALEPVFKREGDAPEILSIMGAHPDAVMEAIAVCTGRDRAWIDRLSAEKGEHLLNTWWLVNMDFFVRRLAIRRIVSQATPASDGETSLPASHGTDTTQSGSADTPAAS